MLLANIWQPQPLPQVTGIIMSDIVRKIFVLGESTINARNPSGGLFLVRQFLIRTKLGLAKADAEEKLLLERTAK